LILPNPYGTPQIRYANHALPMTATRLAFRLKDWKMVGVTI
jgi:hypothetical protein